MTPSPYEITAAVLAAQEELPYLQVIVKPSCYGREWVLDICCSTAYISAEVPAHRFGEVVIDALAALLRGSRESGWGNLAAVPAQRESCYGVSHLGPR